MVNICVLRSGGEYKPEHVQRLAAMVPDLWCLTDTTVDGVHCVQLQYDWPGWWSKIELFRPDIESDLMYFDLDTTVMKMPPMPDKTTVLRDFTDPRIMGSGLMFIKHQDKAKVWKDWMRDPESHMKANNRWPRWGDQGFLQPHLGHCQKWQDIANVYSYKVHCRRGIPLNADVICYHGKPRPWDVEK